MWYFSRYSKVAFVLFFAFLIGCSAQPADLKAEKYVISSEEDAQSEKWAEYLYTHLSKRSSDKSLVDIQLGGSEKKQDKTVKNIRFEFAPDLNSDYRIEHLPSQLTVRVRDKRTALWIIYQLIENIGLIDKRFNTNDLPPKTIDFESKVGNFDFHYREPYFAPNLEPEYASLIGTNNVEMDWGIWGHNLTKIIEDRGNETIYALVNGKRHKEQLCFSSEEILKQTKEYIVDNFGDGSDGYKVRLMIMPADNNLVCTCPNCLEAGNTPTYATPAVQDLIRRLAELFPNHCFFTSAYLSTLSPPKYQFPKNGGVFFSTMDLPKGISLNDQASIKNFMKQLDDWRNITPNIYLWDYGSNFDDYLTPLPMLLGLQAQLQSFKKEGVKGIFLNASGYDYSPFDDVKTFVSAALMMNVNADVEQLATAFFKKNYPESYKLLSDYFMGLEKQYFQKNKSYNMYGSIRENMRTYLDVIQFVEFYETLQTLVAKTKGEEKEKLKKLFTALTFTRLQIAYTQGTHEWGYARKEENKVIIKKEINNMLNDLQQYIHFDNLRNYKESGGSLSEYINHWQQLIQSGSFENALLDVPIELCSKPDEGFEKLDLLNDGTTGFSQDYHQGWYLSSAKELHLRFPAEKLQNAKQLKIRFLQMRKHRMHQPQETQLLIDGKTIQNLQINKQQQEDSENSTNVVIYSIPVNFNGAKDIELRFIRPEGNNKLALDEIQILAN